MRFASRHQQVYPFGQSAQRLPSALRKSVPGNYPSCRVVYAEVDCRFAGRQPRYGNEGNTFVQGEAQGRLLLRYRFHRGTLSIGGIEIGDSIAHERVGGEILRTVLPNERDDFLSRQMR